MHEWKRLFAFKLKWFLILFFCFASISNQVLSQTVEKVRIYLKNSKFYDVTNVSIDSKYVTFIDVDSKKTINMERSEVDYFLLSNGKIEYLKEPPIVEKKEKSRLYPSDEQEKARRDSLTKAQAEAARIVEATRQKSIQDSISNSKSIVDAKKKTEENSVVAPTDSTPSNSVGVYFSYGNVIGKASGNEALDFPLSNGIGGTLQFQHRFSPGFTAYLNYGFLIISENNGIDSIHKKLNAQFFQAGAKYYMGSFYAFFETGFCSTQRDSNYMNDILYDLHSSFTVAPGIGYEIKTGRRGRIDLNLRFQQIFYTYKSDYINSHLRNQKQSIGFIGLRVGYHIIF